MLTNSDGLLHDRKVVPHTPSFCDEPGSADSVTSAELMQLRGY
jgi:hypothetical protein